MSHLEVEEETAMANLEYDAEDASLKAVSLYQFPESDVVIGSFEAILVLNICTRYQEITPSKTLQIIKECSEQFITTISLYRLITNDYIDMARQILTETTKIFREFKTRAVVSEQLTQYFKSSFSVQHKVEKRLPLLPLPKETRFVFVGDISCAKTSMTNFGNYFDDLEEYTDMLNGYRRLLKIPFPRKDDEDYTSLYNSVLSGLRELETNPHKVGYDIIKPNLEITVKDLTSNHGGEEKNDDDECSICLETLLEGAIIARMGRCKHEFHCDCLLTWLVPNNTCPYCRRSSLTDVIV